jgi:hypothetical protein
MYQAGAVVFNKGFLDKLPEDLRKVLLGDAKAEAAFGRAGVRALEPEVLKLMENEGVRIHRSTEAERQAFAKVLEPLHDEFAKTVGADLLAKTRRALADFRAANRPAAPGAPAPAAAPTGSPGTPAPKPMPKPPFPKPQVPK